jgi:hypothetical protein
MRSAGNFHPEWGYLAPAPGFMRTVRIALVATAIGATAGAVVVVSLVDRPGSADDNSSIAAHALVTSAPVIASEGSRAVAPAITKAQALAAPAQAPKIEPVAGTQATKVEAAASKQALAPSGSATVAPLPPQVASSAAGVIASTGQAGSGASTAKPTIAAPINAAPTIAAPLQPNAIASSEPTPAALSTEPAAGEHENAAVTEEVPAKKVAAKRRRYAAVRRWQSGSDARKRWRESSGFGPLLHLFSFRFGSASSTN